MNNDVNIESYFECKETSADWADILGIGEEDIIFYSGWDLCNLEKSFYVEKIGIKNFVRRLSVSKTKLSERTILNLKKIFRLFNE